MKEKASNETMRLTPVSNEATKLCLAIDTGFYVCHSPAFPGVSRYPKSRSCELMRARMTTCLTQLRAVYVFPIKND